jgi:hypothetical protein
MSNKQQKKKLNNSIKAIESSLSKAEKTKIVKQKAKRKTAGNAIQAVINREMASKSPIRAGNARMFAKAFTERHAAILGWMLTVTDPFGTEHVHSIPPILAPGIPMSEPRIYRYVFHAIAVANASGRVYIGANADMWLPNLAKTAATVPEPQYCFLGNSTANAGARGAPVHYTTATYAGTGSGIGLSYPSPASSGAVGLNFMSFPDTFIPAQINLAPASANAMQRAQCISVGLRARPITPATGAFQATGALAVVQQILGDTVQTNPAAANAAGALGGADAYQWITGLTSSAAGPNTLTPDQVAFTEWDCLTWPKVGGAQSWLGAAAIPNQSCCLQPWVPTQIGSIAVGFPQLAILGVGLGTGASIEFEASYTYAFYGAVSYEVNSRKQSPAVPVGDLEATVASAGSHMRVGGGAYSPARAAVAATVQPHVDSGDVTKSSAGDWVKSGAQSIEAVTGSSIGDLIGEGLGFLGAMLL